MTPPAIDRSTDHTANLNRWVPYRLSNQENVCHFFFPAKCAGANRCGATPALLYGVDSYADCYLFSVQETTGGSLVLGCVLC